jgi:hypothetical protein
MNNSALINANIPADNNASLSSSSHHTKHHNNSSYDRDNSNNPLAGAGRKLKKIFS